MLELLAAILALLALYTQARRREIENAYPPLGRLVDLGRVKIHGVEQGAHHGGTPIVLIHGASGNVRDMVESLMPGLSAHHHVIAFDRPGFGWSGRPRGPWCSPLDQARLLKRALGQMGVAEKPLLVGHSWGASVALAWALDCPDEVAGVVSLSGATHPFPGGVAAYRKFAGIPLLGPLFAYTLMTPIAERLIDKGVLGTFWPNDAPEGYVQRTGVKLLLRPAQFLRDAQDVRRLRAFLAEQAPHYEELAVPVTVITGNRDRVVGPKIHSYPLARKAPHGTLVKLENCGHAPHHVRTTEVVDAIAASVEPRDP